MSWTVTCTECGATASGIKWKWLFRLLVWTDPDKVCPNGKLIYTKESKI